MSADGFHPLVIKTLWGQVYAVVGLGRRLLSADGAKEQYAHCTLPSLLKGEGEIGG